MLHFYTHFKQKPIRFIKNIWLGQFQYLQPTSNKRSNSNINFTSQKSKKGLSEIKIHKMLVFSFSGEKFCQGGMSKNVCFHSFWLANACSSNLKTIISKIFPNHGGLYSCFHKRINNSYFWREIKL